MIERSPDTVDSGWNCSAAALGTLRRPRRDEARASRARRGTRANGNGTVTAILALDAGPLDAAWVEEFYTAGAVAGKHTGDVKTDRPTYKGAGQVFRLETINDLSLQTVVIWPAGAVRPRGDRRDDGLAGRVRADHDQRVEIAVEVAAAVPIP